MRQSFVSILTAIFLPAFLAAQNAPAPAAKAPAAAMPHL